jgi:hypothetical protein
MVLDMHVKSSMKHWAQDKQTQGSCSAALRTWERRLDNQHGTLVVPLSSPHTAAYLLDPLYCSVQGGVAKALKVPMAHEEAAWQFIERVGGPAASRQFLTLMSEGWTGALCQPVGACAQQRETAQSMGKRQRPVVWKFMVHSLKWLFGCCPCMPPRQPLSETGHCGVECMEPAEMGMERAKKLVKSCFQRRAEVASVDDFGLLLSVVENTAGTEDLPAVEAGDISHVTDTTATPDNDD